MDTATIEKVATTVVIAGAAFAASKRELGSLKSAIGAAAFQTGMAYVTAILVYFIAHFWI